MTDTYNKRLQPVIMKATAQQGDILNLTYSFSLGSGDNGNVSGITNNLNSSRSEAFTYDALNRLATASFYGGGDQYGYDARGNLLSKTVTSGTGEGWLQSYTATNRLSSWGYDAAGNLINTPQGPYHNLFNAENEWTYERVSGISYLYDGDGQRIESSGGASGNRIYWYDNNSNVLVESDASGNIGTVYFYLNGTKLAHLQGSASLFFYYADHLGTMRMMSDGSGTVCYDSAYFPWGGEIHTFTNTCPHNYKFTGKERDPDLGIDYFGARFYKSDMARFYSPDWSATVEPVPYAKLDNPQTLNLYTYVASNPTTLRDPNGHCDSSTPNCKKLSVNPLASITPQEKHAMNDSLQAAKKPTADDKKGNHHEEGGVSYTQNGVKVIAPAVPGKAADVTNPNVHPEMNPYKAADPTKQIPANVQADVDWHVHAAGTAEIVTPNDTGGVTVNTYSWNQAPSTGPGGDIQNASPGPTINIVLGSSDNTVYVFTQSGCVCEESQKDFNKQ